MRKVDIALFVPDLSGGGAERVAVNLVNEFSARGLVVDLVLMRATGVYSSEVSAKVNVVDLKIDRMREVFFALLGYLRQQRPRALLAFMWPLTFLSIFARYVTCVPTRVVVTEHVSLSHALTIPPSRFQVWLMRKALRLFYRFADGVVTVSKGVAEDVAAIAGIPLAAVTVIYNPLVAPPSSPIPSSSALPPLEWWDAESRILAVGSFKKEKDFPTLFLALARLRLSRDSKLLILGDGQLRRDFESRLTSLGLEKHVYMPGFVLEPSPYFQRAHLFVLCSLWEGFGNVIVEAMNVGTPVVSTSCPYGPAEILENGRYGRLVPVSNSEALAAAMELTLQAEPASDELRKRAADFSVIRGADNYLKILLPIENTEAD